MRQSAQASGCCLTCAPCGASDGCVTAGFSDLFDGVGNLTAPWIVVGGEFDQSGGIVGSVDPAVDPAIGVVVLADLVECCTATGLSIEVGYEGGYVDVGIGQTVGGDTLSVAVNYVDGTYVNDPANGGVQAWTIGAPAVVAGDVVRVIYYGTSMWLSVNGTVVAEYQRPAALPAFDYASLVLWPSGSEPLLDPGFVSSYAVACVSTAAVIDTPCPAAFAAGTVVLDETGLPLLTEAGECILVEP